MNPDNTTTVYKTGSIVYNATPASGATGRAVDDEIQKLVDERQAARKAKDFKRADEIRDMLKAQGIILEDTPQGVKITRA